MRWNLQSLSTPTLFHPLSWGSVLANSVPRARGNAVKKDIHHFDQLHYSAFIDDEKAPTCEFCRQGHVCEGENLFTVRRSHMSAHKLDAVRPSLEQVCDIVCANMHSWEESHGGRVNPRKLKCNNYRAKEVCTWVFLSSSSEPNNRGDHRGEPKRFGQWNIRMDPKSNGFIYPFNPKVQVVDVSLWT